MRAFLLVFFVFFLMHSRQLAACTAFYLENSPHKIVAKTLDWPSASGLIFINKRNMQKKGVLVGDETPLEWISSYMSLTLSQTGRDFPWEGMNERGLSVNSLELLSSKAPLPHSDSMPAIDLAQWIQYILDTSSTLNEAIENAKKTRVMAPTTLHYFVCDSTSQCAVFEYIRGELVISSLRETKPKALSNDNYSSSLDYLFFMSNFLSPQNILNRTSSASLDRFARAALLSKAPIDTQNETAQAFSAINHVSQENTQWKMIFSLKNNHFLWKTRISPSVKSIDLNSFHPNCSTNVQILDPNIAMEGEIRTYHFTNYSTEINNDLVDSNTLLDRDYLDILKNYPATMTKCLEGNTENLL